MYHAQTHVCIRTQRQPFFSQLVDHGSRHLLPGWRVSQAIFSRQNSVKSAQSSRKTIRWLDWVPYYAFLQCLSFDHGVRTCQWEEVMACVHANEKRWWRAYMPINLDSDPKSADGYVCVCLCVQVFEEFDDGVYTCQMCSFLYKAW
jgi:hypothetical protein